MRYAAIISLVIGALVFGFCIYVFHNFIMGIIFGGFSFFTMFNVFIQAFGDVNRATQDKRDEAILDELRKMNSKDE